MTHRGPFQPLTFCDSVIPDTSCALAQGPSWSPSMGHDSVCQCHSCNGELKTGCSTTDMVSGVPNKRTLSWTAGCIFSHTVQYVVAFLCYRDTLLPLAQVVDHQHPHILSCKGPPPDHIIAWSYSVPCAGLHSCL